MRQIVLSIFSLLLTASLHAQVVDGDISASKDWQAVTVAMDEVWQQPACVASTPSADGTSTLEVIAMHNPNTGEFGEPLVHIITPFDVNFFEVSVTTSSSAGRSFPMLPVTLPQPVVGGVSMVGARALFDDRSELVRMLRIKNSVTARYFDAQGEVKSLSFSLRGSSATIRAMFEQCGLEFSNVELGEPLQELN